MSVDRSARDELCTYINRYLDNELTAFEFDDAIFDLAEQTDDETVENVVHLLWYHYDDCYDHKVRLNKHEWNYFQRLLLLLQSDAHLESFSSRRWNCKHAVAGAALGLLLLLLSFAGLGPTTPLVIALFGLIAIAINQAERTSTPAPDPRIVALTPFDSYSQLWQVYESVEGFRKKQWPKELHVSRLNQVASNSVRTLSVYLQWLMAAPFALFWLALPDTIEEHRVTLD